MFCVSLVVSVVAVVGSGFFFFQAEDGIRDLVRSRGLGDVYKRQVRRTWFWLAAGLLILLISFSRLYLGIHYPQDVVGGLLILSLIHI